MSCLHTSPPDLGFSLQFAFVWWSEYHHKNPNNTLTWDAMKQVKQARFVPSYYARDL
jgi:hypothetical protein